MLHVARYIWDKASFMKQNGRLMSCPPVRRRPRSSPWPADEVTAVLKELQPQLDKHKVLLGGVLQDLLACGGFLWAVRESASPGHSTPSCRAVQRWVCGRVHPLERARVCLIIPSFLVHTLRCCTHLQSRSETLASNLPQPWSLNSS